MFMLVAFIFVMLGDLVARAVAVGATPGVPASEAEVAAAETRLGVRFDSQYRELMAIGSGIEGLGSWFWYPVAELGVGKRWLESKTFLIEEYFHPPDAPFLNEESYRGEPVRGRFHPAPAGRRHVLIGENIDLPGSLVTNFPTSDPAASSDIAYCRWEPEIFGDVAQTLTQLIEETERRNARGDPDDLPLEQWDRSGASTALMNLRDGISEEHALKIRHALSTRRRREFDQRPVTESIRRLRKMMWCDGAEPQFSYTAIEHALWGPGVPHLRAAATFPESSGMPVREAIVGVVQENTVWRVDSMSWA
ncbi:hypothetical protein [Nocardia sp. NPDC057030]